VVYTPRNTLGTPCGIPSQTMKDRHNEARLSSQNHGEKRHNEARLSLILWEEEGTTRRVLSPLMLINVAE